MTNLQIAMYEAVNYAVLSRVPKTTKYLLDLGCGSGSLGQQIKKDICCKVIGITHSQTEAKVASKVLEQVLVHDLNSFDFYGLGKFDCIICSHVLEHLYQPQELLHRLHKNLSSDGTLIVALPNVLYWKQRLAFLKGNFKYTDGGLMDQTHFRFFDWDTALELVQNSGFEVISQSADGNFPLPIIRKMTQPVAVKLDKIAIKIMPGLFGFQFIIVARVN